MRKLYPLLPLLLLAVGCSQNPHVNVASQPVHATSSQSAQKTDPAQPQNPAPADPTPGATPPDPEPDGSCVSVEGLPDADCDGVPDIYDKCPNVPGPVFNDGCPLDQPPVVGCMVDGLQDRDCDGVPDIYDKCPDVKGPVFNDGCPLANPAPQFPPPPVRGCPYPGGDDEWRRVVLEVKESLKFDFDRSVIKPESFPALHHLESFMKRYPLSHVFMVGHTDDVGSDAYNMWLSRSRVFAVKDFLVHTGIPAYRITLDARGKREPLVSVEGKEGNALEYARAMNRRVDMDVRWEVSERR